VAGDTLSMPTVSEGLAQGWANYGPRAACGPWDHFMRPAGTCRNYYACRILWNIYYFYKNSEFYENSLCFCSNYDCI